MKIIATIPARRGSKRVKQKNLRLIDDKPLIWYAINAAKNSSLINEVYVNTECDEIGNYAIEQGVKFYKRPKELAQDAVTSDEFNNEFMGNVDADVVVMVNSVAPLTTGKDIDEMLQYYIDNGLDTLIPVKEERLHSFLKNVPANFDDKNPVKTFCDSKPLNFNPNNELPMTQNIDPVQICTWNIAIWNSNIFRKQFSEKGHAVFSGNYGLYPVSPLKGVKISYEEDFLLAEVLLKNEYKWRITQVNYDTKSIDPSLPEMWMSEVKAIESVLSKLAEKGKELNILEWGSGKSTIWFSEFLKSKGVKFKWNAIENFIPWHMRVSEWIKEKGLEENTLLHLKNPTCEERKELQEKMDLTDYVYSPKEFGVKFDFILVDARRRVECLTLAAELADKDGFVALHDAEREDCFEVMEKYYENGGEFVTENKSPVPGGIQKVWVGQPKRDS